MYSASKFHVFTDKNGEFFGFEIKDMFPTILDYSRLKKMIKLTDGVPSISDKVNKVKITSISVLRKLVEAYIDSVFVMDEVRARFTNTKSLALFRNQIEIKLLVNQLIFDVLYDKFKTDSQHMTLHRYCEKHLFGEIYGNSDPSDFNVTSRLFLECLKHVFQATESHNDSLTLTDINEIFKAIENKAKNEAVLAEDFNKARENLKTYINNIFESLKHIMHTRKSTMKNIHELMREDIKREINIMNNPAIREQSIQRGIDPDLSFEYFSDLNERLQDNIKKPQYVWDYIYYNANPKLATSKQYKRTLKRDSNTSYTDFAKDLDDYDKFVQITFGFEEDDSKYYYTKSMNYYHLERYKKLDFTYKLAMRMSANELLCKELSELGRRHFLVIRFVPEVCCLVDVDGGMPNKIEHRYYPPLVFVDELFQEQGRFQNQKYFDIWHIHHFIRAKVYELLRYHNTFDLEDYDDIAHFIKKDYDILSYHDTNKVWGDIGEKVTKEQKELIKNIVTVNNALFWKSEDRTPVAWENPRKTECE